MAANKWNRKRNKRQMRALEDRLRDYFRFHGLGYFGRISVAFGSTEAKRAALEQSMVKLYPALQELGRALDRPIRTWYSTNNPRSTNQR